jgi:hypothetical protein
MLDALRERITRPNWRAVAAQVRVIEANLGIGGKAEAPPGSGAEQPAERRAPAPPSSVLPTPAEPQPPPEPQLQPAPKAPQPETPAAPAQSPGAAPRRGPAKGSGPYVKDDEALFGEMGRLMAEGKTLNGAAIILGPRIKGGGSLESRAKRLASRYANSLKLSEIS